MYIYWWLGPVYSSTCILLNIFKPPEVLGGLAVLPCHWHFYLVDVLLILYK